MTLCIALNGGPGHNSPTAVAWLDGFKLTGTANNYLKTDSPARKKW